ncbi:MAG TPA: sorbosone dehydrogenase family protein, partial [Caulobacteraceae bacterium]|nr:sorbosone dehydrogenase family protein [Caulobacteraceae bacterium]
MRSLLPSLVAALLVASCSAGPALPPEATYGPNPPIGEPQKSLLPTVRIAPAKGWPEGQKPTPPAGFAVDPFAAGLDHPRWLYVLPNGDVLVAESNAQPRKAKGLMEWIEQRVMKAAGAGVPSADRISLLRDADGDGRAEVRTVFLDGLKSPFGMQLLGDQLYVANTDAVLRFPYTPGATRIAAPAQKVLALNAVAPNGHWTRNLIASPDGSKLYVTVGSNSNVGENGMNTEEGRAAIHVFNPDGSGARLFASGLRNPNGLAWEPVTGALWTTVNERDELGNDLVPDYMTSVKDGGFYGWPYSYWGQHVDTRVEPQRPDLVASAIKPDYALGTHTAPLGLAFYTAQLFPQTYRGGAFIGQHGSWNRDPPTGYKVIFVPFAGGMPSGPAQDFLTGFLSPEGDAWGRPVGVVVDPKGALLVADDVGNVIWRVTPIAQSAQSTRT